MGRFLLASAVVFLVLVGWLYVQQLYRRFAARNPRLGPFRSEATCQGGCGCHQGGCGVEQGRSGRVEVALPAYPRGETLLPGETRDG